jgi:hypothetical protein
VTKGQPRLTPADLRVHPNSDNRFKSVNGHVTRRRVGNGEANKLLLTDRPVHQWYRFVLSFPPHLVRDYLAMFKIGSSHRVLDPFCGTGTTLVECKKLGIPCVGVEANPMAHFASRVKTDWSPDPEGLIEHAARIARAARATLGRHGIYDDTLHNNNDVNPGSLKQLPHESSQLLLANSISQIPLHKTIVLLETLHRHEDARYRDHELLALAKAVVFSISNLHFGPEVGVAPPKPDALVIPTWLSEIRVMAQDLRTFRGFRDAETVVHHADARRITEVLEPQTVDAVITSPPYPNEKDYTRTTRLESVLLGFVQNKADLRTLKAGLVRSNTRNVYKVDDDDHWVANHPEIRRIAQAIENRRKRLGKTSGFERLYARVTKLYFGGMARHLADLRLVLRPGAQLAYVVGDQASYLRVMIRTGQLLADIGKSLGYEVTGIDLFRTRLATATKAQLREEVVLLRWPGPA